MATFSMVQLSKVHDSTTDLATNWMPSIEKVAYIRTLSNQIRRA
jgi:hypothetical protein